MKPLVSVITVCYNAAETIAATLDSVRAQTWRPLESVVVDGGSKDGTQVIVARYADITGSVVSEPDGGIYDAMNKAVSLVKGEYIFFLNAGDRFADANVLADVLSKVAGADVIYGDVVYFGTKGLRRKRFNWLTRGRLVFGDLCHQVVFVRRDLFARFGRFDTGLRYNADFDWLIRVFHGGAQLQYIARDIAMFHDAGAHVQAGLKCEAERNLVRRRYCRRPLWLLGHWVLRVELKLRRYLGQEVG